MKDVKKWWFSKKIEEFPENELAKRIEQVMKLDFKNKIKLIPYIGGSKELIEYSTNELIALCPATGYPDIYTLQIFYIPNHSLPELKSLKFYLMEYISIPISHEHLCDKIYNDFLERVKPIHLKVVLKVARRGGIDTIITREY